MPSLGLKSHPNWDFTSFLIQTSGSAEGRQVFISRFPPTSDGQLSVYQRYFQPYLPSILPPRLLAQPGVLFSERSATSRSSSSPLSGPPMLRQDIPDELPLPTRVSKQPLNIDAFRPVGLAKSLIPCHAPSWDTTSGRELFVACSVDLGTAPRQHALFGPHGMPEGAITP